jgi:hypothetical protein
LGYFDGLTDAAFKKDSQGKNLFFPWGVFGAGYVLEDEAAKNKMRRYLKINYMIMLPSLFLLLMFVGAIKTVLASLMYSVWFYFQLHKMTRQLPRSTEKLKLSESSLNSARSHSLFTLILLTLLSLGFVAAGIWISVVGVDSEVWVGYMCIVFFGLCSASIGYMTYAKLKYK